MRSDLYNLCVDCADPWQLAQFWSAVLDRPVHPDNEPGDDEVGIGVDGLSGEFMFLRVPEPKTTKNRLHVCLRPDTTRDEEVERVLALGARVHDDRRNPDGTGWVVLLDPEGNEFCVLRSAGEYAATPPTS